MKDVATIAPLAANESLTKSRLDHRLAFPTQCEEGSNAGSFTSRRLWHGTACLGSFLISRRQGENAACPGYAFQNKSPAPVLSRSVSWVRPGALKRLKTGAM